MGLPIVRSSPSLGPSCQDPAVQLLAFLVHSARVRVGRGARPSPEPPGVPGCLGEVDGLFGSIHHDARNQLLQHHRAHHGYRADVLLAGHAAHQPQACECPTVPCLTLPQGPGRGGWPLLCTGPCKRPPHSQVLCIGPTGTGKTLTISDKLLKNLPMEYISHFLVFSARTSANQTQDLIDSKLDKRHALLVPA